MKTGFFKWLKNLGTYEYKAPPMQMPKRTSNPVTREYERNMLRAYRRAENEGTLGRGFGGIPPKKKQLEALKIK